MKVLKEAPEGVAALREGAVGAEGEVDIEEVVAEEEVAVKVARAGVEEENRVVMVVNPQEEAEARQNLQKQVHESHQLPEAQPLIQQYPWLMIFHPSDAQKHPP